MKKILTTLLTVVLTATLAIGGTMAYLTDRDSKANVFTVGDVKIELDEEFEQGSELTPGVDINKDVQITNTGKNDAWVWYTYAVPTALVDTGNDASKNIIHFNLEGAYWDTYASDAQKETGKTWHWEDIMHEQKIDESGISYTIVTVLYNTTLAAGETTPVSLTNVYLDKHVDIDPEGNMNWVESGDVTPIEWNINEDGAPVIYVSAYAIQEDGFNTVQEAYAAYNAQWGDNGTEIAEPATVVDSAEELTAALGNGGSAVLDDDVKATAPVYVTGGTLDGAGNTLDFTGVKTTSWPNAYAVTLGNGGSTVQNLTITNAGYAIGSTATTDDVYINNVTTDYVTYAINGNGNGSNSVYVTNSNINGWCSYSNIKLFSFDNCTLATGNSYNGYLVIYGDTSFNDCTFKDFAMCARNQNGVVVAADKTVSFDNCFYVIGEENVKVTADNFGDLFTDGEDEDFEYLKECNVIIDGVAVSWN